MALFKTLRGPSSRIGTEVTPFHDGYVYFTPDNNGLYIDALDANNNPVRYHVNEQTGGSTALTATLLGNGWSNGSQTLTMQGVTANTNGVIGLPTNVTASQRDAADKAMLHLSAQGTNSITVTALSGTAPTVDIPIVLIIFG